MEQLGYTEDEALDYYRGRLECLAELARERSEQSEAVWITYERVVADPDDVLERLTAFLGLKTPLSRTYTRPPRSDRKGVGDSKGQIAAGEIVKPRELDTAVSERVERAAAAAHEAFTAALRGLVPEL